MSRKNYGKYLIVSVILLGLIGQMCSFADSTKEFYDISRNTAGSEALYDLTTYGIVDESHTYFRPDDLITRAEFSRMLVKLLKIEIVKKQGNQHDDINENNWAYDYANTLVENGFKLDIVGRKFRPDETITIPQITKILLDYLGYKEEASIYANDRGYEILNASMFISDSSQFADDKIATRLDVVQIFQRALDTEFDRSNGSIYSTIRDIHESNKDYELKSYRPNEIVSFEDDQFEKLLRLKYELPEEVKWKDLRYISKIEFNGDYNSPIRSLVDLVWFENLTELNIIYEQIDEYSYIDNFQVDIPNLAHLASLDTFIYNHSDASIDLQQFWSMSHLKKLDLVNCYVNGDLTALEKMVELEELEIGGELTGLVSELSRFTKLKKLKIFSTFLVGDLGFIGTLEELQELRFSTNNVNGNLSDIEPLKKLKSLWLSGLFYQNSIIDGDLEALSHLTNLETLIIYDLPIQGNVNSLSELRKLKRLTINNASINGNINNLIVRDLEHFAFAKTHIEGDISHLKYAMNLNFLDISDTAIGGDLNDLKGLDEIEHAYVQNSDVYGTLKLSNEEVIFGPGIPVGMIDETKVYDPDKIISFMDSSFEEYIRQSYNIYGENILWKDIIAIEIIDLTHTEVMTINDVMWFKNLKEFVISDDIYSLNSELSVFEDLLKLEKVDLRGSWIKGNLSVFRNHSNLLILDLTSTDVVGELKTLSGLVCLKELYISSSNGISGDLIDLMPFKNLEVYYSNNSVLGDLSSLSSHVKLKKLNIKPMTSAGSIHLGGMSFVPSGISGNLSDLNKLTKLEHLRIYSKYLSSPLSELEPLTNLKYLYIHCETVTGDISTLATFNELIEADISAEKVTGHLDSLSTLEHLVDLEIVSDLIKGTQDDLPDVENVYIRHYFYND